MAYLEIFLNGVGLSMDAFAVSVCKGLSVQRLSMRHTALAGLYFGGFQFLMPVLGWLMGFKFEALICSVDHWIAFILLALIGANMIKEPRGEAESLDDDFGVKTMLVLAVATSIDALAVGISKVELNQHSLTAASFGAFCPFLVDGRRVSIA